LILKSGNFAKIIVDIQDKIIFNFMGNKEEFFPYNDKTFLQLINSKSHQYFKNIDKNDFQNALLITHKKGKMVSMVSIEKKISEYKRGDRFLIQYTLGQQNKVEQMVKDN